MSFLVLVHHTIILGKVARQSMFFFVQVWMCGESLPSQTFDAGEQGI